jgi:23S rRNA pseudouridine1911/1915/1917 synthase
MKELELCFLEDFDSAEEAILLTLKVSRNQLKKYGIKKKYLTSPVKKGHCCRLPIDLINHLQINPNYSGPEVEMLEEDENFIILNKPYKVHIHPLCYSENNNLVSYVQEHFPQHVNVNKNNYDRGFIYRLDYETSGIVYYAKKDDDYDLIRNNFHDLISEKNYYAIVSGKFDQEGEHSHFLKGSGRKGHKILVFEEEGKNTQEAKLEVSLIEYDPESHYSLVKVSLESGLRHQIRAQLSFLGYPILGDVLYGGAKAERVFLHAYQYRLRIREKEYSRVCKHADLFERFFDLDAYT